MKMKLLAAFVLTTACLSAKDKLTGDWNGARPSLKETGVQLDLTYMDELMGNPIGGRQQGIANAASTGLKITVDFEKIAGTKGLSLINSYAWRFGTNLSSRTIDNQFNVATVFGGETYRLNELYLQERMFHNKVILKAGRMEPSSDFLYSPLYSRYVSLAFNSNPIAILFNTPFTDYPFAVWSACLHLKPHPSFLMKFGIYNNNPKIRENKYHGCYFPFKSTQGVLLLTEWVGSIRGKRPGNYFVGGYYVTGETAKFEGGEQRGNWGYYFLFDQMIWKGFTPFGAFLFAPKNRNKFPVYLEGGFVYMWPYSSRPNDSLDYGVAYGQYSSELREVQRQAKSAHRIGPFGNHPETAETLLELNYWFQIQKYFAITPVVQYIINPKGYGIYQNAFVIGLQVFVDL